MISLVVAVAALAATLAVASTAFAAAADASPAPRAQLTGLACRSPRAPAARAVSIETVMRPVPGTRSLAVRLTLLARRRGAAAARPVAPAGDLGVWLTPAVPTLGRRPGDVWKLAKTVYDVAAAAHYRFAVQFRWRGVHGAVLRRVTLRSPTCAVTDPRPRQIAVSPH